MQDMKFIVPSGRVTNLINDDRQLTFCTQLRCLEQYFSTTRSQLQKSFSNPHHQQLIRHERLNCSLRETAFMHRLIEDDSITIKPADKNLGLVLVDTSWYDQELTRMLQDRQTYVPFKQTVTINGITHKCSETKLSTLLYDELQRLMNHHTHVLEAWNPDLSKRIMKYAKTKINRGEAVIPSIYLLIKVHKPKGLCGRPIVPCTRWVTTPASVLADHLLQEILREANLTHIVKDTKSFVNELEHMHDLPDDGEFLTGDIGSLYTNILTVMGLKLVREFLREQKVPSGLIEFIMDLLSFVMHHSYLTFKGKVYHQRDGTAMGTTVAPTYANIVVYMLERHMIKTFGPELITYRRYLDDVWAYVQRGHIDRLKTCLNSLHPKLVFEFSTDPIEAAFLDLHIFKGDRFAEKRLLDLRVHQKKMNLYLYIPFSSYHTDAAKRSFIQTELMRYIRNTSDQRHYNQLKQTFYSRLRDRGYPDKFLQPVFSSIFYSDRDYFLYPSAELMNHPDILKLPPRSACLLKRMLRAQNTPVNATRPPVFVIPFSPLSRHISIRSLLLQHWELISGPAPIIAYQSQPSLASRLVYMKAQKQQRTLAERLHSTRPIRSIQSRLSFRPPTQQLTQTTPTPINRQDDGPQPMEISSQ